MRTVPILIIVLAFAGCAIAPAERLKDGERKLAAGDAAGAQQAFEQVLADPRTTPLDRGKAEVGAARAFLQKGDLVGARTRFRRIADNVSDKWYYLGVIAMREGDRAEAEARLKGALERAHGADTASLLAQVMAGEARSPDPFEAAAAIVEGRGAAPLAEALRVAAGVWREATGGADPAAALARLAPVKDRVGAYASARVLEARLLDRTGKREEAAALWDLSAVTPRPSDAYKAWAADLRAALALESGDAEALDEVLRTADPTTAARVRAELARGRAERGDPRGALDAWTRAAATPNAPPARAAEALAEAAALEDALGLPTAADAWKRLEPVATASPLARARLALRRAAEGDLLGGAALAPGTRPGDEATPEALRARCRALRKAAALFEAALEALVAGRDDEAGRLARAMRQLDPGGPAGKALAEALAAERLPDRTRLLQRGRGATRVALDRAALRLHLAQGDVEGLAALLEVPELQSAALADLGPELEAGLQLAIDAGRLARTVQLLERHAERFPPRALARLRASAPFRVLPDTVLPAPRGPAALPPGPAVGALTAPASGLRLPRVLLERGPRGGWSATWPDGTRVDGGLEALLGERLDACAFTADPAADAERFAAEAARARGERFPVNPVPAAR